jgi:F-type H+-transporting ATPase subunit delta
MPSDERLIAARYVQALFDLASENKQHDKVKADMLTLKSVLSVSAEFQKLLTNPVISREDAQNAIAKVLEGINACDLTRRFFALLARNRRLALTAHAIDAYLAQLAESRGELAVQVTSAQDLSDEEIGILSDSVAKATGKKVQVKTSQNPALLGGLQVRYFPFRQARPPQAETHERRVIFIPVDFARRPAWRPLPPNSYKICPMSLHPRRLLFPAPQAGQY